MPGLEELINDRSTLLAVFIEDAFRDPIMQADLVTPEEHASRELMNTMDFYWYRGMTPFRSELPQRRRMRATFCGPIILAETGVLEEQAFLAYLVYWTFRMKVRVTIEGDLADVHGDKESMLEDLVESEMIRAGVPRWWDDRIIRMLRES